MFLLLTIMLVAWVRTAAACAEDLASYVILAISFWLLIYFMLRTALLMYGSQAQIVRTLGKDSVVVRRLLYGLCSLLLIS